MKRVALLATVLAFICGGERAFAAETHDLHSQTAAALLGQKFGSSDISYLLLDSDGQIVAQRWRHSDRELPVGSLVKPFIAVAYGRTHQSFPSFRCTGKKTCWLPRGHGLLQLRDAIAFSCNSYFHQLYMHSQPGFAAQVLGEYGLSTKTDGYSGEASPLALARAYLRLARDSGDKSTASVLEGMALSAKTGTGKAAGAELPHALTLAKTGTALCTHSRSAPGDGFSVLMVPADRGATVLLVRVHGKPGSFAAGVAGQMMAAIENTGVAQ